MGQRTGILFLAVLLAACTGSSATDTTGTTGAVPTTATSLPATTTTTGGTTTTLDEWEAISPWRGGPAGEYRSRLFSVPFSFTTDSAWTTAGGEATDYLAMAKPTGSGVYLTLHDGSIEEALAFYQDHTDLEITSTGDTTVGGAEGTRVDGEALRQVLLGTLSDGSQVGWLEGTVFTVHLIDVAGTTVEVSVDRVAPLPSGFEEEAQAILDSIVWRDLVG